MTPQQQQGLPRLLIKELKVMSREEILPTYRVPVLVAPWIVKWTYG